MSYITVYVLWRFMSASSVLFLVYFRYFRLNVLTIESETNSLKHLQWNQLYQFAFYIRLVYSWYRATIWKFRIFAAFFLPTFFISRYLSFRNVCQQFVSSHFSDGIRPWNRSLYLYFYLAKLSSQNDKDKCK